MDIPMRFKGEQLKFVEMDDAIDIKASSMESAMNAIPEDDEWSRI